MMCPLSKCLVLVMVLLGLSISRPNVAKRLGTFKGPWTSSDIEMDNARPPVKVLLLAYHRSGSSFTGDLLSAGLWASFYFEPLHNLKASGKLAAGGAPAWPSPAQPSLAQSGGAELVREMLTGIFDCKGDLIDWLSKRDWGPIVRKRGQQCRSSKTLVVKTIRAHRDSLLPWIIDTDIKVVHLVRDPRGMKNSASGSGWDSKCGLMMGDLELEKHLPENRYIRVRYEDLVDKTEATLFSLYLQLGIQWTRHVISTVYNLTHAEENHGRKESYYSTFRSSSFQHDYWKDDLSRPQVEDIERDCSDFMDLMGYRKLYNTTSTSTVPVTKRDVSSTSFTT